MQLTIKKTKDELLEDYLLKNGIVGKQAIAASVMEKEVTEEPLGNILVKNGFLKHEDFVSAILEVTDKSLYDESIILPHIPPEILLNTKTKISAQTVRDVYVSTLSSEDEVCYNLKKYFINQNIIFVDSSPDSINEYLDRLNSINDGESSVLEQIIRSSITGGVSDIHIQPRTGSYSVFFRHNGVRRLEREGGLDEYLNLNARIKDRSRMDLAERRIPQDGGFDIEYNGRLVDLRVATVPTLNGEIIVIRILDPEKSNNKLDDLGITDIYSWRAGASLLHGLCLVCGATGSGKTTTLNGTIRELDRFGKAIYTAEDPVEYTVPYVGQVNINDAVGLDFSRALKAFMRADPDVIILGEVRDENTARNAIKAAETGHLVFATLHTSSILGSINRLRDLGVPIHELKYVLRSVLAQTLIRVSCKSCHGEDEHCPKCMGTGYSGRTIVSECYYFNDIKEIEDVLNNRVIKWKTMLEDAYGKYMEGITDKEEIIRVFGADGASYIEKHGERLVIEAEKIG